MLNVSGSFSYEAEAEADASSTLVWSAEILGDDVRVWGTYADSSSAASEANSNSSLMYVYEDEEDSVKIVGNESAYSESSASASYSDSGTFTADADGTASEGKLVESYSVEFSSRAVSSEETAVAEDAVSLTDEFRGVSLVEGSAEYSADVCYRIAPDGSVSYLAETAYIIDPYGHYYLDQTWEEVTPGEYHEASAFHAKGAYLGSGTVTDTEEEYVLAYESTSGYGYSSVWEDDGILCTAVPSEGTGESESENTAEGAYAYRETLHEESDFHSVVRSTAEDADPDRPLEWYDVEYESGYTMDESAAYLILGEKMSISESDPGDSHAEGYYLEKVTSGANEISETTVTLPGDVLLTTTTVVTSEETQIATGETTYNGTFTFTVDETLSEEERGLLEDGLAHHPRLDSLRGPDLPRRLRTMGGGRGRGGSPPGRRDDERDGRIGLDELGVVHQGGEDHRQRVQNGLRGRTHLGRRPDHRLHGKHPDAERRHLRKTPPDHRDDPLRRV